MSKNIKFKLNGQGVRSLLQGSEMQSVLNQYATGIRNRCGTGYTQDTHVGRNRANVMIKANTFEAKLDNHRHNTILKALK